MSTPSLMINLPKASNSGVTSLNSETGAINIVAGTNITVTPSGQNITIASSGGGGGSPASPSASMQYNNSGSFGGSNLLTPDSGISFGNTAFSYGVLQNLLRSSVDFRDPWIGGFASFTAGQASENGLNHAIQIVTTARQIDGLYQNFFTTGSNTYTFSVWAKGAAGGEQLFLGSINNSSSFTNAAIDVFSTPFTLTTSWARYVFTGFTPTAATVAVGFFTKTNTANFNLFGPQLETNAYAGIFLPTGSNGVFPPVVNGQGLAVSYAYIDQLALGTHAPSPFYLDQIGGAPTGRYRLSYNTTGDYMQYNDNSGTQRQVAIAGGSSHTISSIGSGSFSSGTASISDGTITTSSFISIMITSANSPGVYQISTGTGSASVQSYNTGFSGTNFSDGSSFMYVVIN